MADIAKPTTSDHQARLEVQLEHDLLERQEKKRQAGERGESGLGTSNKLRRDYKPHPLLSNTQRFDGDRKISSLPHENRQLRESEMSLLEDELSLLDPEMRNDYVLRLNLSPDQKYRLQQRLQARQKPEHRYTSTPNLRMP